MHLRLHPDMQLPRLAVPMRKASRRPSGPVWSVFKTVAGHTLWRDVIMSGKP